MEVRRFRSDDGLSLAARLWEPAGGSGEGLRLLCLPGLTRNSRDFEALGRALSGEGRRVVAVDYRGRGLSDRDPEVKNYAPAREAKDVLAIVDGPGLGRAVLVGTSRGGIVAMALAAMRPGLVAGVVLNDVGPVMEEAGLARIRAYLKPGPPPADWDEAAARQKAVHGAFFPGVDVGGWAGFARAIYAETQAGLVADHDPALAASLNAFDPRAAAAPLWAAFEALKGVPVLVIRGALSDLLSEKTVAEMAARHPRLETWTVPGEGHAPLLADAPTIRRIAAFAEACERA